MESQNAWRDSAHSKDGARVLMFSMRNLSQHVSHCQRFEFEDVIAEVDGVDFIAPRRATYRRLNLAGRVRKKLLRQTDPLIEGDVSVHKDYELFIAMIQGPWDLRYLLSIKGLRARCRKMVCRIDEFWYDDLPRLSEAEVNYLREFDCLFTTVESSAEAIEQATKIPTHFVPAGVDAIVFCPYPQSPTRCIDVLSIGRRPAGVHQALLEYAAREGRFYVHDTVSNFPVIDPGEHRLLFANMIKRSRYFIAFPGKFDLTSTQLVLGNRYFEGTAGGSILLGHGAENTRYADCFDWPDAIFSTPSDGSQIVELIAKLDEQPERLARIRKDSVLNAIRRHDWVYSWRHILEVVDLPIVPGITEREKRLQDLAEVVSAEAKF